MIVVQTNRIFLVQEVQNIDKNIIKVEQKKDKLDCPTRKNSEIKYIFIIFEL